MYDSSISREMVFYKYHRQSIAERPEYSKSRYLSILHRHSRGYKRPFQKSRVTEKLADFSVYGEIIGISVSFENVIVG